MEEENAFGDGGDADYGNGDGDGDGDGDGNGDGGGDSGRKRGEFDDSWITLPRHEKWRSANAPSDTAKRAKFCVARAKAKARLAGKCKVDNVQRGQRRRAQQQRDAAEEESEEEEEESSAATSANSRKKKKRRRS